MITSYEEFEKALNPTGKQAIDKTICDLTELAQRSPNSCRLFCIEYKQRKAEQQTEQKEG